MVELSDNTTTAGFMGRLFGKDREIHMPGEIGIWIFILGDMTLYMVLFFAFMVDRSKAIEFFTSCQRYLHPNIGGINMLILLVSSVFVAVGVRALRLNISKKAPPILFALAFLCGAVFVFNKYIEYSGLLGLGITPMINLFFTWYWCLTLLHLAHLLGGMGCLVYMINVSRKSKVDETDIRGCESAGCFWHAVDLLWVVLFPLLYLMR
jgi:nitric oxide reductase NorE protein